MRHGRLISGERAAIAARGSLAALALAASLLPVASGCGGSLAHTSERDLGELEVVPAPPDRAAPKPIAFDGSLDRYVAYAMENSPELRAVYEEWRVAVYRVPQARRLPDPTVTYAYFVRNVETRVGPQRHRLSLRQAFPWPTKLSAGEDAAELAARSAAVRFDAATLTLTRRVADAYWQLWLVHRMREVAQSQRTVLEHLSAVIRARVEVGQASLADLGHVDLSLSRLTDLLEGLDEREVRAHAALVTAIGAPSGTATPVTSEVPEPTVPAESADVLHAAAREHPRVRASGLMAESKQERARSVHAERFPGFALGLDWIETGEARAPGVPGSGKDAVMVSLSMSVPLWGGAYGAAEDEAHAESAAFRAREAAARIEAVGEVEKLLSEVRDAARRVRLHRDTLVPQAETVYGSVLGSYTAGRSALADLLLAERQLLDLQQALYDAAGEHAIAWARLEEIVGRPVKARER